MAHSFHKACIINPFANDKTVANNSLRLYIKQKQQKPQVKCQRSDVIFASLKQTVDKNDYFTWFLLVSSSLQSDCKSPHLFVFQFEVLFKVLSNIYDENFRSSHQRCPVTKVFLEKFRKIHRKTPVPESFSNKFARGLQLY